jgi:hypothetical protein
LVVAFDSAPNAANSSGSLSGTSATEAVFRRSS